MGISYPPTAPVSFERAMVFIDGSNVFPNFREYGLKVSSFANLGAMSIGSRQLTRTYLYTTREKLDAAKQFHGQECFEGCRIVLGDSVPLADGIIREKGVDALLVADLIYHAAMKNFNYAIVISNDSDFAVALKRVEDFGCRTGLVSVLKKASQRLIDACDDFTFLTDIQLLKKEIVVKA